MVIAQRLESIRVTSTPGASRSASITLVTPERRMSSAVMTKTAAAVSCKACSIFAADTTFTCISSSMLSWVKSGSSAPLACPMMIPRQANTTCLSITLVICIRSSRQGGNGVIRPFSSPQCTR